MKYAFTVAQRIALLRMLNNVIVVPILQGIVAELLRELHFNGLELTRLEVKPAECGATVAQRADVPIAKSIGVHDAAAEIVAQLLRKMAAEAGDDGLDLVHAELWAAFKVSDRIEAEEEDKAKEPEKAPTKKKKKG